MYLTAAVIITSLTFVRPATKDISNRFLLTFIFFIPYLLIPDMPNINSFDQLDGQTLPELIGHL